jgi:hypothetical protein
VTCAVQRPCSQCSSMSAIRTTRLLMRVIKWRAAGHVRLRKHHDYNVAVDVVPELTMKDIISWDVTSCIFVSE